MNLKIISPILLAFFLCACSSTTNVSKYYLLPMPEARVNPALNHALRYIYIPDYLDRKNIVYFVKGAELDRQNDLLWQADMSDEIKRFLHLRLGGKLYPLAETTPPNLIVDVRIADLIANKEKENFSAQAEWSFSNQDGKLVHKNNFSRHYELKDFAGENIVAAHACALDDIANAINQDLENIKHK